MKVIQLSKPGNFTCLDQPTPTVRDLRPGQALVRVHHVGLCGTDIHAYRGNQPFFSYPRILGHELGVEIEALAEPIEYLKPGMRCAVEAYLSKPVDRAFARGRTNCSASTQCLGVHVDGGMREKFILPANKLHPSSLPTRSLALVETLCIGHHAVERAGLYGDETAAVIGMGPIGLGVLQFARLQGLKLVAIDISPERLQMAESFYPGLQTLQIEPAQPLQEGWGKTGLEVPEVVWDCTGNKTSMEAAIGLPANGGKVVLVGIHKDTISFQGPDFHRRELAILSSRNATGGNFRSVINLIENGLVDTGAWITHEVEAENFPSTIEEWLRPGSGLLKGVIKF